MDVKRHLRNFNVNFDFIPKNSENVRPKRHAMTLDNVHYQLPTNDIWNETSFITTFLLDIAII